jgi:hypothetical protein
MNGAARDASLSASLSRPHRSPRHRLQQPPLPDSFHATAIAITSRHRYKRPTAGAKVKSEAVSLLPN